MFSFSFLLANTKVFEPDAFLHIKMGEYMLQHKHILNADPFVYTYSGNVYANSAWLSQIIYYLIYNKSGFSGIVLFKCLLIGLTYAILYLTISRIYGNRTLAAILSLLAAFASKDRFLDRPEMFTLLFISFIMFVSHREIYGRRAPLLYFLVFLLWANLHAGFLYGIAYLGALSAGSVLEWLIFEKTSEKKKKVLRHITVFIFSFLGTLFTPLLFSGYRFAFGLTGLKSAAEVLEWKPLFDSGNVFLIAVAVFFCFLALVAFRDLKFHQWFIMLVFIPAGFWAWRNAYEMLIVLSPIAAMGMFQISKWAGNLPGYKGLLKCSGNESGATMTVFLVSLFLICFVLTDYHSMIGPGAGGRYFPSQALGFVKNKNLSGNIFNSMNYGGPAEFILYPERQIFIDGLATGIAQDFLKHYVDALEDGEKFQNMMGRYNIGTILIESDRGYITRGIINPEIWKLVYWDDYAMVLVRRDLVKNIEAIDIGDPADIIGRIMVAYEDELGYLKGEILKSDRLTASFTVKFALGLICIRAGDFDEAIGYLEGAIAIQPYSFLGLFNLARAYKNLGYPKAVKEIYERIRLLDGGPMRFSNLPFRLTPVIRRALKNEMEE